MQVSYSRRMHHHEDVHTGHGQRVSG
jgi:hypothetical protein